MAPTVVTTRAVEAIAAALVQELRRSPRASGRSRVSRASSPTTNTRPSVTVTPSRRFRKLVPTSRSIDLDERARHSATARRQGARPVGSARWTSRRTTTSSTGSTSRQGVRPMNASSLVCTSASSGTSTRGPYCPLERSTSSSGCMPSSISAQIGVEPLVQTGRPGEVPAVHEDVARVDHVDGLRERHRPDVGEVVDAVGGRRIVEQRLHGLGLGPPRAARVVVDRRARRQARCRSRRRGTRGTNRRGGARRHGRPSPRAAPAAPTPPDRPPRPSR